MKTLNPTYLRYVYDGIQTGTISSENSSVLPHGLVGIYEEAFMQNLQMQEREKVLIYFTLWSLIKSEVSLEFVSKTLNWNYKVCLNYLSKYSKWFNSTRVNHYSLYHDSLRIYFLSKISNTQLLNINQKIILKLNSSKENIFFEYKYRYIFYHYMINNKGQEFKFLMSNNTFYNAKIYCDDITFFHHQFNLLFLKFANSRNISKFKKLLQSYNEFLNLRVDYFVANYLKLCDVNYLTFTIEEFKKYTINQRKIFWFEALYKLINDKNISIEKVNSILNIYDNQEETISSTIQNTDENVYSFNSYSGLFKNNIGIDSPKIFMLLNFLLNNKLNIDWLINRFFWFPSREEAKDGFIQSGLYFENFKLIKPKYRKIIIDKFKNWVIINNDLDFWRTKTFLNEFIDMLSSVEGFIENNDEVISNRLDKIVSSAELKSEIKVYNYNKKFLPPVLYLNLITNKIHFLSLVDKHELNLDLSIQSLLKCISNNIDLKDSNFIELFIVILEERCNSFYDDGYWIEIEYREKFDEIIYYLIFNLPSDRIYETVLFISKKFEIIFWNDYGLSDLMTSCALRKYLIELCIPFLLRVDKKRIKVFDLIRKELFSTHEVLLCYCEINDKVDKSILNDLNLNLESVIAYFAKEPIRLFYISNKLKLKVENLFYLIPQNEKLNFLIVTLLLANKYYDTYIFEYFISKIKSGLSKNERDLVEANYYDLYKFLSINNHLSKMHEFYLLQVLINSNTTINLHKYYKISKNKLLFLFTLKSDKRYIDQLLKPTRKIYNIASV